MQTIGLIAAMSRESSALLRYVKPRKRIAVGALPGYEFSLSNLKCILVTSGMGIRRASEAAHCLMDEISPQLIMSFGIAGAVEADLDIGDVVLLKGVCRLEHGSIGPIQPLAPWPEVARAAAAKAMAQRGARLLTGIAITTSGSQTLEYRVSEIQHPVLEMETAGIAQAAAEIGTPFLALRAISDGPSAPIPFDLGEVMDQDANLRLGRLLKQILSNPRIIMQFNQMRQNAKVAADHAVVALVAALSNTDFNRS